MEITKEQIRALRLARFPEGTGGKVKSQRRFGKLLGLTSRAIASWENGERRPNGTAEGKLVRMLKKQRGKP